MVVYGESEVEAVNDAGHRDHLEDGDRARDGHHADDDGHAWNEPTEQDATLALYAQLLKEARELSRRIVDRLRSLNLDPGAVPEGVAGQPDAQDDAQPPAPV